MEVNCVQLIQGNGAGIVRHLFFFPPQGSIESTLSWREPFYANFNRPPHEDSLFDQQVRHGNFDSPESAMKAAIDQQGNLRGRR